MSNCDVEISIEESKKSKKPPKLVYCGDGVLEEYSEDEEEIQTKKKNETVVENIDTVSL